MVKTKRAYEPVGSDDGYRVLVDRLWPRGRSKVVEEIDIWLKEVAPSTQLREWFHANENMYDDFAKKYEEELQTGKQQAAFLQLKEIVKTHNVVSLIYGSKDETHNNAQVLLGLLEKSE